MSRNRRQVCELIADLSDFLSASLIASGINGDIAAEVGPDVADKIAEHYGGQSVYFPFNLAARRNAQIYAEFTGENHYQLASKYKASVQHIYRVIKIQKAAEIASRQPMLFPE